MRFNNKKGQVTIFIIVGIIIVMIAILLISLERKGGIQKYIAKGVVIPEQAKGFTDYVENCITELSLEGLDIIGMQGGYIEVPDYLENDFTKSLEFDDFTTIPYWVYINGKNIPEKEFIEDQLDNYIENNFNGRCSFDGFINQGYKVSNEEIKTNVEIDDENVIIKLDSILDIEIKDSKFGISDYINIDLDHDVGKLHKMSKKIVEDELKKGALEFNTINLIAIYSREDFTKIPPLSGIEFRCGKRIWLQPQVKNLLKQIFVENIPKLRILKTNYQPYDDIFYDSMTWDIFNANYGDIAINFNYFDAWPINLDVSPSDGAIIKSNSFDVNTPFMFLCTNMYNFAYDVSYPIVVSLINDENYMFRFPIVVDVRDNYARRRFLGDVSPESERPSLFCNLDQRLSDVVEISNFNADNGKNLENVEVIYSCGVESCSIGETDENGRLRVRFPYCNNGEINFIKDGYLTDRQKLDITPESGEFLLSGRLEPFKEVKVNAKVFDLLEESITPTTVREYLSENYRGVKSKEKIIIHLNRISNYDFNEYDYQTSIVIENNEEFIELIPGSYDVQVILTSDETVVIPEQKVKEKILGITVKTVTIPETKIEEGFILGGIEYNLNILPNDLNKDLEFYALSKGIPRNYENLENNFNIQGVSAEYIGLMPQFK